MANPVTVMKGRSTKQMIVLIVVLGQRPIPAVVATALLLSAGLGTLLPASAYVFET
jgi:hypothetical protein